MTGSISDHAAEQWQIGMLTYCSRACISGSPQRGCVKDLHCIHSSLVPQHRRALAGGVHIREHHKC